MVAKLAMLMVLAMVGTAAVAQPTCPLTVAVQVDASLLPDGQPVTVRARWITDWRGTISSVRVDNVTTGADGRRGELNPKLLRAIQHAVQEQVRCAPHPDGWTQSQYPFVRQVRVQSG